VLAASGLVLDALVSAPLRARVDAVRLRQALANLVDNALKFTPAGGHVQVRASLDNDTIEFRVTNTGPGIPDAHLRHLFDRFWQARANRGGAGLGLAIVKGSPTPTAAASGPRARRARAARS
jgi:signal transduction histidine kinase